MFTSSFLDKVLGGFDACPWGSAAGRTAGGRLHHRTPPPLYTPDERRRRDASPWTMVQGVLAPIQFAIFLTSLALVLRYLASGDGQEIATASIVVKTLALYTIMLTGSVWEKKVFGRYLFAPAFFWEDAFSILVLLLHTAYLFALATNALDVHDQLLLALAAYASYVVNAMQFVMKLRAARLAEPAWNRRHAGAFGQTT